MIQDTSAMDRPVARKGILSRRVLLPAITGIALVVIGAALYPRMSRWLAAERSFDISRLRIGVVSRGDIQRDLSVQGRTVAAFHPTTFSPADGIVSLRVKAGDVVERGTVLAVVDSPALNSRLEQERSTLLSLESDLERQRILAKQARLADRQAVDLAQVELEAAERAMSRAERTRAEGILNDVEYENAQDDLRRARVNLAHAGENADLRRETLEFEIRNRELQVERHRLVVADLRRQVDGLLVRAPVGGLVSRLDVNDRDAVAPSQALVTVVDLTAFEVEIMIPENYADEIGPGTPAVVNYEGREYPGRVKSISPEVEGSQVRGIVEFEGTGPEGLRQNQRVTTRLVLESRSNVLKVDRGPFLEAGGGRGAYRIDGDLAVRVPIEAGATSVSEVEILSGLEEGDRIIISDTGRFEGAETVYLRR